MQKVVLGLSGGMDSVTLLGYYLEQGYSIYAITFAYGSKHNRYENQAAKDVVQFYKSKGFNIVHIFMDISNVFQYVSSNLLLTGGKIPEGHYNAKEMKDTVVPGRNLIMSSIMAGIAESNKCQKIALGVHSGDHHIYLDCRPAFITGLNETIFQSSGGSVAIKAPFLNKDKTDILRIGYDLKIPVPYELTRTCYKNQKLSCGKCGSCVERLEAFKNINKQDPIKYE